MTASTKAHLLLGGVPQVQGGAVLSPVSGGGTQTIPMVMYGAGTPAGTIKPWTDAPIGSIWLSNDQTTPCAWVKTVDNDAVADWVKVLPDGYLSGHSKVFNIDNGAAAKDYDVWYFEQPVVLKSADLIYTQATDASGAAEATFALGTAADGGQYVAAVNLAVSSALGTVTSLSLVATAVAAGSMMYFTHTGIAATEAGEYKVRLSFA